MRIALRLTSAFIALLGLAAPAAAKDSPKQAEAFRAPGSYVVQPSMRLRPKGGQWDYEIRVAVPADYDKTKKDYPVLWVLDGSFMFEPAVVANFIHGERYWPRMIIVGVGLPPEDPAALAPRRIYDFTPDGEFTFDGFGRELNDADRVESRLPRTGMNKVTGGAPQFLDFLLNTVKPAIAQKYRVSSDHTLFGESAGGLFCTYAFLSNPQAFKRYLCASPGVSFGNFALLRMEEERAKTDRDLPAEVLLTAGEAEITQHPIDASGAVSSTIRLAEILSARKYPSLKLHVRVFPGEDHGSVIFPNFAWGLRALWADEWPAKP